MAKLNASNGAHENTPRDPFRNGSHLKNARDASGEPDAMLPSMSKEGIAIIGIGCRFPGGVNDAESFWKLLTEGREAVCEVPADRWNVERFYDAEPGIAGKSIAKRGGFLESDRPVRSAVLRHLAARSALRRSAAASAAGDGLGGDRRRRARARSREGHRHRRLRRASRTTTTRSSRARRADSLGHQRRTRPPAARTASPRIASRTASISAARASRWTRPAPPR